MNIIKRNRLRSRMTQKELARKCNIDQSYISELETYNRIPSPDMVIIISDALRICPILIFEAFYCNQSSSACVDKRCKKCKK